MKEDKYFDIEKRTEIRETARKLRRQFLRYQEAELVYSMTHRKLLEIAGKAGAIYRIDNTVLINRDEIGITLATIMAKTINEEDIELKRAILKHEEGVDLIPGNIELSGLEVQLSNVLSRELILKEFVDSIREEYEYILIDCAPSLGMMTINALVAADEVIIPVQAAYLPVKGLQQLIKTINMVKRRLNKKLQVGGILLAMVDYRTNYAKNISAQLYEAYGTNVGLFKTYVIKEIQTDDIKEKIDVSNASEIKIFMASHSVHLIPIFEKISNEESKENSQETGDMDQEPPKDLEADEKREQQMKQILKEIGVGFAEQSDTATFQLSRVAGERINTGAIKTNIGKIDVVDYNGSQWKFLLTWQEGKLGNINTGEGLYCTNPTISFQPGIKTGVDASTIYNKATIQAIVVLHKYMEEEVNAYQEEILKESDKMVRYRVERMPTRTL